MVAFPDENNEAIKKIIAQVLGNAVNKPDLVDILLVNWDKYNLCKLIELAMDSHDNELQTKAKMLLNYELNNSLNARGVK